MSNVILDCSSEPTRLSELVGGIEPTHPDEHVFNQLTTIICLQ